MVLIFVILPNMGIGGAAVFSLFFPPSLFLLFIYSIGLGIVWLIVYFFAYLRMDGPRGLIWSTVILIISAIQFIPITGKLDFLTLIISGTILFLAFYAYYEKRKEIGRPLKRIVAFKREWIQNIVISMVLLGFVITLYSATSSLQNYELGTSYYSYGYGLVEKSDYINVLIGFELIFLINFLVLLFVKIRKKVTERFIAVLQHILGFVDLIAAALLTFMSDSTLNLLLNMDAEIYIPETYSKTYITVGIIIGFSLILVSVLQLIRKEEKKQ
jgi:hypothetical protein